MPHIKGNHRLIFRLVSLAINLLIFIGISGCSYEPYEKRVAIEGDNFYCRNCFQFGHLIELQGNLMAIAEYETLFLFERNSGAWKLVQEIKYGNSSIIDIVLTPSLLAVRVAVPNSSGKVELFEKVNNGLWSKFQELSAGQHDAILRSINILNDRMVIGINALENASIGRAYIYRLENKNWILESELKGNSKQGDGYATDVSLVGNYALVSAKDDSIQVFKRDGSNWSFHQFLQTNEGAHIGGNHAAIFENEIIVAGGNLTALTLESTNGEFVGRTLETPCIQNCGYNEVEMYNGYALVSTSLSQSSPSNPTNIKCFLFRLNGSNWSLDREFDEFVIGIAISNQFIALGTIDKVSLYPL